VTGNKKNIEIDELFRNKLENNEIIPDDFVDAKVMKKLARKEFLSFNRGRFNIYYLGGIVSAGVIAGALLITGNSNGVQEYSVLPGSSYIENTDSLNTIPENNIPVISVPESKNNSDSINKNLLDGKKHPGKPPKIDVNIGNETGTISQSKVDIINGKDLFGNSDKDKDSKKLRSLSIPDEAFFEPSVTAGCSPLKVRFVRKYDIPDSCRWVFGDGGSSTVNNPEWIFDEEGDYNVVLNTIDQNGVKTSYSTVITVYPTPLARFEIIPENPLIPDDEIRFVNYSTNAICYLWSFGDGTTSELFEPVHKYSGFDKYNVSLIISSEHGCSDSLIIENAFSGSSYFVKFPNAFIAKKEGPTGGFYSSKTDENAEVFHPTYSGVSDYQLKIFSKLGILIFESNDINIGWDGYLNGQLCKQGVYIWKVRGTYRNGEPFIMMGDVTLIQ
jgi:PKD repeat protein